MPDKIIASSDLTLINEEKRQLIGIKSKAFPSQYISVDFDEIDNLVMALLQAKMWKPKKEE